MVSTIYITLMILHGLKIIISCLGLFSVAVLKFSDKTQLKGSKGLIQRTIPGYKSIVAEKSQQQQELKVADHIVSA